MDILNVEEVVYNLASLVDYQVLHQLQSINKSYYHISNNVIKHYDQSKIMEEFKIEALPTCATFKLKFRKEKYNELEEIISDQSFSNHLKIKIINNIKYQIGRNGFIIGHYKDFNFDQFMIAYNILRSLPK